MNVTTTNFDYYTCKKIYRELVTRLLTLSDSSGTKYRNKTFSKYNQNQEHPADMSYRLDSKLPFRCFVRQDTKHTPKTSNAADSTPTNDARVITTEEYLSLS